MALQTLTLPNPGQTTKVESLSIALASDDDLLAKIGEVQASPTANTVLDRLKALLTGINLAASANHIGEVGGRSIAATASFTRPADTSAYAVGDLIANSTTAASVVPMALAVARINGGTGIIRKLRLKTNDAAWKNAVVRVHLFELSPTVTVGDNGVFNAAETLACTESSYIGYADVTLGKQFSDSVKGFAMPGEGVEWTFVAAAASQNVYALLEARTALTPASAALFTLSAETHQN
jgi:hypothetical protein